MTREDIKTINDIVHKTIYGFFDVCSDEEETPMTDKDKLLLEVNKAVCNNIKDLEQEPKTDVLNKIRAEIKGIIEEYDARCERFHYKPYKPTKGFPENSVAPRTPIEIESRKWGERAEGLERALKIIDKHMNGRESEGAE